MAESLSDVVESPLQLILAQSLVKGEKFDFIIQKATELGVSRISPLITRYAEAKIEEQQIERRLERWRRISLEALKQCGRRRLVDISAPRTLTQFIADVPGTALLLLSERGGVTLTKILEGITNSRSIAALVGPEGGWSDHELELLTASGATPITLGRRVLRTETAALAAIALIQHMKGDLSVEGIE